MMTRKEWHHCLEEMDHMFPDAHCELVHRNPFDLLIATLLSAQCTDKLVNRVTATLFQKYAVPEDYAAVPLEELEQDIRSIGLYRNKAKNIQALSRILIDQYESQVPADRDLLMTLPGVGRKTANVVVSVAFDIPALAVDTHVERVAKRLGMNRWKDTPLQVEETIMKKTSKENWSKTHHQIIFFGRYHCKAQNPGCHICPLFDRCREGKKRDKKGLVKREVVTKVN
ncbi:endonuclease III [Planomicrobium sp. CPCC 101110]|uniref:endonuclease III n=1 Tax=Planomicrobium sp. CPCC 101110 TaxID=2599619 RepID=UPI0011B4444A|nr:endonuclease III [Planomicrobium sp. CPCC 101110]TWT28342.1 endonuclease III [Planomicrobium sp. CPCC 101110]